MSKPQSPNTDLVTTVAFATADGEHINEHFGSARQFVVHALSASTDALVTTKVFPPEAQDGNEDKLKTKLAWLKDYDVMVCAQVGQSAAQQLLRHGVQPIAVEGDPSIRQVVDKLQSEIASGAAWTRRVHKPARATDQLAELAAGDWNE
jgi:nitrogen fixation protein NifX